MTDLWTTVVPLAVTTVVLPIQLAITILMLRSAGGAARAGAWISGMTIVRLLQYAVFGAVLTQATDDGLPGTSAVEGALLLVVGVVLLVSAARKAANQPDEDAPPPRWMSIVDGMSSGRAFLMGAGLVAFSPKLWAFTLGAIGAIGDAQLGPGEGWIVFAVWVALAQALHLLAWLSATLFPAEAEPVLARASLALERYSRPLVIAISLLFGAWFMVKALSAFGIPDA